MGLGTSVGEALGKLASAGAERVAGRSVAEEAGKMFKRTVTSEDRFFDTTEISRFSRDLIKESKRKEGAFAPLLAQAPTVIPQGVDRSAHIQGNARIMAHEQTFGSNYKALATLAKISHVQHGQLYTESLMDHIALTLRDDKDFLPHEQVSEFKRAAIKEIGTLPEFKEEGKRVPYFETSPYSKPGPVERWVTSFVVSRLAPLMAIPHLGTALNPVEATQLGSWTKALAWSISNSTPQQIKDTLLHAGVLGEGVLRRMRNAEMTRNGFTTRSLPGSMQDILAKISPTPFFSQVRDWEINFTGAACYLDAVDYADQLGTDNGDMIARQRLERYGMRPSDIASIEKTGKLTTDQLERAVYHGVNRQVHLDTTFSRSFNAQRNGYFRAASLFHGYISRQGHFMAEEIYDNMIGDSRSILGTAKMLAIMGAAFPVAGEALKIMEMTATGQWQQIRHELREDYKGITFQQGKTESERLKNFLYTYAQAHAHLGNFGVSWGLIIGAHRGALAASMNGPMYGTAYKYIQDVMDASKSKRGILHSPRVWGDIAEISLGYGLGKYTRNYFFPTKRQLKEREEGKHLTRLPSLNKSSGFKKFKRLQ